MIGDGVGEGRRREGEAGGGPTQLGMEAMDEVGEEHRVVDGHGHLNILIKLLSGLIKFASYRFSNRALWTHQIC